MSSTQHVKPFMDKRKKKLLRMSVATMPDYYKTLNSFNEVHPMTAYKNAKQLFKPV